MKNKKIAIICIACCIILGILILISINKDSNKDNLKDDNNQIKYNQFDITKLVGFNHVESEISNSLEMCKKYYLEENNQKDFYSYYKIDYINDNILEKFKLVFIEDINKIPFEMYDIYNSQNKILSKFPYDKVKNVSKENLVIEPNQDFIVKTFNSKDCVTYYFKINISDKGEYKIEFICYTYGEIDDSKEVFDEDILKMWENDM